MEDPNASQGTSGTGVDRAEQPHHLEQQRRENRDAVVGLGFLPYGGRTDGLVTLAEAHALYDERADLAHKGAGKEPPAGFVDERPVVRVAGRVVLRRIGGSLIWLNIRDHTGDLQIAVSKKDCGGPEGGFGLAKRALDLGDIVVARGPIMKTNAGEVTVWASELEMASKCLVPPPEKHKGLADVELRYRQRYVDMWSNPETLGVFLLRSKLVSRVRRYLDERGFLEVETPVLQQLAGGAAARPFVTHMNALDVSLFLRIAPELYLKRLLVGGMPRVYEMSRNFRNEGLDKSHNPEFTSLEVYQAFGDYETMLDLTEGLVRELALLAGSERAVEGGADGVLPFGELRVDYGSAFVRVTYAELFERSLGFPMDDFDRALTEADERGFKTTGEGGRALDPVLVVNELFEEVAEARIDPARPTFVMDYPASLSPLTRPKSSTLGDKVPLAERWDLFIGGMEIGPAYTELNDPDVQEAKFREQLAGIDDEEQTFRTFDADFVRALKVGMPPAGGLGLGIDRLTMLLADQPTIRDVLLFPMMRPEA